MWAQSAKIEAGYVLLPERAPWLQDFQTEILRFPYGRHDDQVDIRRVARVITGAHWSGPRFFGLNGTPARDTPNDPRDD